MNGIIRAEGRGAHLERGLGVLLQELGEALHGALPGELDDGVVLGGHEVDGREPVHLRAAHPPMPTKPRMRGAGGGRGGPRPTTDTSP